MELTDYRRKKRIEKISEEIASGKNVLQNYEMRGLLYQKLGNYDEALNDFNKTIELNVNEFSLKHNLLTRADHYFFKMQKYDDAIKDYVKIVQISYNNNEFYIYWELNITDHIELICDLSQDIKLDPENPDIYLNRGLIYLRTQIFDRAADDFKETIRLNPQYSDFVTHLLVMCYVLHGNLLCNRRKREKDKEYCRSIQCRNASYSSDQSCIVDEAAKYYNHAIKLDPENPRLYIMHGLVCRNDEAVTSFTKAIKLNPNDHELYYDRALAYKKQGAVKEAEEDIDKIKEVNPNFTFKFYLENENYTEALQSFKAYITKDSLCDGTTYSLNSIEEVYDASLRDMAFDAKLNKEKYERIIELSHKILYNAVVELYPQFFASYMRRGVYFMEKNKYDDAIKDFAKCIELYSDDDTSEMHSAFFYFLRGICNGKIGQIEKADEDFKRVVDSYSYSPGGLEGNMISLPVCYFCPFSAIKSFMTDHTFQNNFISKFINLDYSKFLIFVAENSSIAMMLKSMSIFTSLDYKLIKLAECFDNLDWEGIQYCKYGMCARDYDQKIDDLLHQIFLAYPNHKISLEYLLKRDGEDSFFLFVKLSFLKLLLPKFLEADKKSSPLIENEFWTEWKNFIPDNNQRMNFISMYFHLHKKGKEREKARAEIEHERKLKDLRTNIFQGVSHTISNIMLGNKSITKRIKSGTSSMNDVNRLELLNNLVLSTMNAIKLVFSNEDIVLSRAQDELFCEKINDGISLHDLLYFCLNINLYYLVVGEGEEGWATIRNIFFSINRYDKKDIREKLNMLKAMRKAPFFSISELSEEEISGFVNTFQSEQFQSVQRFFMIQIQELESLYVKKESYTFSVLFIILLELTKNMLRYGTIQNKDARKFIMKTETDGDNVVLTLTNTCQKSRLNLKESTLKGLAMIQEFSKVLGRFEKAEKEIEHTDLFEFTTRLFIRKPKHQKMAQKEGYEEDFMG